jgi:hypothetical protein
MTLFYRVERDGVGPYRGYDGTETKLEEMLCDHGLDYRCNHPTPWEEPQIGSRMDDADYRCGFHSMEQMMEWFDGWGDALAEYGFRVHVYDIPEFIRGCYQSIADTELLTKDFLVETFSPAGM